MSVEKLTLQQKVDTTQALLDLDEARSEGWVEIPGGCDRQRCLRFLAAAKRQGVTPSEGRFAIGRQFLEYMGGRLLEGERPDVKTPLDLQ